MKYPTPIAADWKGWRWPVKPWAGRQPAISHEFEAGERYKLVNGKQVLNYAVHLGLDIMFPWKSGDPTGPTSDVAMSRYHSHGFIAPRGILVFAAGPGKIWDAGPSALGLHVQIDHGNVGLAGGVNTYYQHLESFAQPWKRGDVVEAGELLGVMGGDPANSPHLRHLHFELWFPRAGIMAAEWPTDPAPYMRLWAQHPIAV